MDVGLLCIFVHEPPYQKTTVLCCNPIFYCGSMCMNHHTALHVGLAQAHPNIFILNVLTTIDMYYSVTTMCAHMYLRSYVHLLSGHTYMYIDR